MATKGKTGVIITINSLAVLVSLLVLIRTIGNNEPVRLAFAAVGFLIFLGLLAAVLVGHFKGLHGQ